MFNETEDSTGSRWISVVFIQGDEAKDTIGTIARNGAAAAIHELQRRDSGDDTTASALENGYVYEGIPASSTDRTFEDENSEYALAFSPTFAYVSLLRRYSELPERQPVSRPPAPLVRSGRARQPVGFWTDFPARSTLLSDSVAR
jgi:hypothetical protein